MDKELELLNEILSIPSVNGKDGHSLILTEKMMRERLRSLYVNIYRTIM